MSPVRFSREFAFENAEGQRLGGRLDLPGGAPRGVALLAHCFTCSKDSPASAFIARALAAHGIATLRFDFTGLGNSQGDFANTNFSSNLDDLVAAARALETQGVGAPDLLIGHSLGGAAVIAAARHLTQTKAIVTINAPADPAHVLTHIEGDRAALARDGIAPVSIGGRSFTLRQSFIDDIRAQPQAEAVASLGLPLLVMHAPADSIVPIEHGERLFLAAHQPKSFVALAGADHLLAGREAATKAAEMIAAWVAQILPPVAAEPSPPAPSDLPPGAQWAIVAERGDSGARFANRITIRDHRFDADEPREAGGADTGPAPHEFLLASLGACTSMTLRMYADRKGWPLRHVAVTMTREVVPNAPGLHPDAALKQVDLIERRIVVDGDLDDEQRARLLEIANKCPVHRTLENRPVIRSRLA